MNDAETLQMLSEDLQRAAIRLITHLQTNHARIRIAGTMPELYITLSEGRHPDGAEAMIHRAQQEAQVAAAQERVDISFLGALRKVFAA